VVLADVNGDSKLDLIAVNAGYAYQGDATPPLAGNVTVSLGKGDGTFQSPVAYIVGQNPGSVLVADINGDGKQDLIVGTVTGGSGAKIAVLAGNGNGTFAAPAMFDTYTWSTKLFLSDIDGDGKPDLVILHAAYDAPLTVMQGNGDGTFHQEMVLNAGDTPVDAVAADFTGDGRPDLAVLDQSFEGDGNSYVAVFRNISPAAACAYTLGNSSQQVAAAGGPASFKVIATTGCEWTASTTTSWITLAYPQWGGNGGGVNFTVAANTGPARTGTINIGGKTFTVNQAGTGTVSSPQVLSVDPASGNWAGGSYTFTFSHPSGWQNINVANILINKALDAAGACYIAVLPASSMILLIDDAGNAGGPYQTLTLPGNATAQNSQCSIAGTGSSISGSGSTLTVTLAMTFKYSFAGNKIMYLAARDIGGGNSGWQALGTCGISGPAPSGPFVGGVSPARSSGAGGSAFVFTFYDTNGWQDLGVVNILVNDALDGRNACYLAYSRAYNTLYLVNDAGTSLLSGTTLTNSQCMVTTPPVYASGGSNVLTLTVNISFPTSFAGNRIIYIAARSNGDALNSGWQAVGSRTIQ
jgi:hypothetical protein